MTTTNEHDEDQTVTRLIAEAEQQVRLPALWAKLTAVLERERITGPVRAAHYAGERAYHVARTAALRAGATAEEADARGRRAFWAAYFADLTEEAAVCAKAAREEMRRHGDPPADAGAGYIIT